VGEVEPLGAEALGLLDLDAATSQSAQKPSESAGTETLIVRSWLVPRRPIQPAWRYGKLVRIVESVPIRFA
jgi:hypothetical protein